VTSEAVRFAFGANWSSFLRHLDDERIAEAERALLNALGKDGIAGKRFLDVGSGSGLFSLAAHRIGAARVHSFDYDQQSVACTDELRTRFANNPANWIVEKGSALDDAYLASLGAWDVVYSWGVLHHTGDMWSALDKVARLVAPGGTLFIAIYNDQGRTSRLWHAVKLAFNRGAAGRLLVVSAFIPYWGMRAFLLDVFRFRDPRHRYRDYKKTRGMSLLHDWIDWLGGYPFEVARPEEVFRFFRDRGFVLREITTCGGGLGCNEYVFVRAEETRIA